MLYHRCNVGASRYFDLGGEHRRVIRRKREIKFALPAAREVILVRAHFFIYGGSACPALGAIWSGCATYLEILDFGLGPVVLGYWRRRTAASWAPSAMSSAVRLGETRLEAALSLQNATRREENVQRDVHVQLMRQDHVGLNSLSTLDISIFLSRNTDSCLCP